MKAALLVLLASCATFEPAEIVIDLRVLAMAATVPDQVVDVDVENPPEPLDLLDQLVPTTMCALVADPVEQRRLHYSLTLCVLTSDERCFESLPQKLLVEGVIEDPETTVPRPEMCATIEPDGNLAGIVLSALEVAELGGLGGVDYGVALQIGVEDEPRENDQLAGKTLRIFPRIPSSRTANANPAVDHFTAAKDGVDPQPMPMGRCVDQTAPLELVPTQRIRILPVEPPDSRETYTVPTLDGMTQTFTESFTYQWLSGPGGSLSTGSTGGPRDPVTGNPAPLFTDFRAPPADAIDGVTDIPIWIIQRDERLGARWYETCVRVRP